MELSRDEIQSLSFVSVRGVLYVQLDGVQRLLARRVGPSEVKDGNEHANLEGTAGSGGADESSQPRPRPNRSPDRSERKS